MSDSSKNKIYGGAGDDGIYINSTNNEIYAGAGNDSLEIKAEYNKVDAGAGNDVIEIKLGANRIELEAGAGNDIIKYLEDANNCDIDGGAGNDIYYIKGGIAEIEDSAGNDTYYIDSLKNDTNRYTIDDDKGKDTLVLNYNKDKLSFNIGITVDSKGKIVNIKDTDVNITSSENGYVKIDDYFGSGCIERIETADGYYVTKDQLDNVAQEIAAWLSSNGFGSTSYAYNDGDSNQIMELNAIFKNINWQQ